MGNDIGQELSFFQTSCQIPFNPSKITKNDRMNGYLPYSRVKEDTRLNDAKMAEVAVLVKEIKETFSNKTIQLYTGFCWDGIKILDVVQYYDVIVDGPFIQEKFDGKIPVTGTKITINKRDS